MDPALWELLQEGESQDEVAAIARLSKPDAVPQGVRVIAQMGNIITCRLRRDTIREVRSDAIVESLKASHFLGADPNPKVEQLSEINWAPSPETDERFIPALGATGRDVVVGIVDWGLDFVHPDFLNPDGTTRILALWDQRPHSTKPAPQPYGYGVVHYAEAINQALASDNPYAALDYYPTDADSAETGAHGTHVASIAVGNGGGGGPIGVAPKADLVFVHLSNIKSNRSSKLGDSVALLEAVDFIDQTAGDRPCVINLSIGRHAEQHDGSTLVEQGLDAILEAKSGRAICQSCGNYYTRDTHASGQVRPGEATTFFWQVDEADFTPNELEIWYSSRDVFEVKICSPNGICTEVKLGERSPLIIDKQTVGTIYHRAYDPNNNDHLIQCFLYPHGPTGDWEITLIGKDIVDGRCHAWVERDLSLPNCQSQFHPDNADPSYTTGAICNGFRTIAVGAYNPHSPDHEIASFSSAGPTRDGRIKPDLVAPGVSILAARSASNWSENAARLTRKSGTSMATPHVTGTVALMFEAADRPLRIDETRRLLLASTHKTDLTASDPTRFGSGYLDTEAAVQATRTWVKHSLSTPHQQSDREAPMNFETTPPTPTFMSNDLQEMDEHWDIPDPSEVAEATSTRNFILISGGPGLFDNRDIEHDKSWANYVTPPLLLTNTAEKLKKFAASDEEVWWFIYKPAYVRRWEDDLKQKRKSIKEVKDKGFSSYVNLLEGRAKARGWNLRWFSTADQLWDKLKTFKDPIARVWYWGHASGGLWLTLSHSAEARAVAPEPWEIVTIDSIKDNASLKKRFQAGSSARLHRFIGCNTRDFAQKWADTFEVWTEGFDGKIDFSVIHQDQYDGEPSLVGSASRKRFSSNGVEVPESITEEKTDFETRSVAIAPSAPTILEDEETEDALYEAAIAEAEMMAADDRFDSCGNHDDWADDDHELTADEVLRESYSEPITVNVTPSTISMQLVRQVDHDLEEATTPQSTLSPATLVHHGLSHLGLDDADMPYHLKTNGMMSPAAIFDAFSPGGSPALRRHYQQFFEVIARPGDKLEHSLQEGDILIRRVPAEGTLSHLAVIAKPNLYSPEQLSEHGLKPEVQRPGRFAQVIEGGAYSHRLADAFTRRITNAEGILSHSQMILRLITAGIDIRDSIPTFSVAQRRSLESPLLIPSESTAALTWNRDKHPKVSGVTIERIAIALSRYVDFDRIKDTIKAYNSINPTNPIPLDTSSADNAVFVEAIHQFQMKCYLNPKEHDGLAGESVLDNLGLLNRTGMHTVDKSYATAQTRLNQKAKQVEADTGGEFTASNWFKHMVNPSFLGQKFTKGIHRVFIRKCRIVEKELLDRYPDSNPVELGKRLGIEADDPHRGMRFKDGGNHKFGLAADIRYRGNPWITGNPDRSDGNEYFKNAMNRVALLIAGEEDFTFTANYLHKLGTTLSTSDIHAELSRRDQQFRTYLRLADDQARLQQKLEERRTSHTPGIFKSTSETVAAAAKRWQAQIKKDLKALTLYFDSDRDPRNGFLNLSLELVTLLRDKVCMAWGAVDFGSKQSGDVMHFDCRVTGVGKTLSKATPSKHPCQK
jgi:subtilisin family serine protease